MSTMVSSSSAVKVNKASGMVEVDVSGGPAPGHYEGETLKDVTDEYKSALKGKHTNANAALKNVYGNMNSVEEKIAEARADYNKAQTLKATLRPGTNAHKTQKNLSNKAAATLARLGAAPKLKHRIFNTIRMRGKSTNSAAAKAQLARVIKAKKAACGWGWLGAPRGASGVCASSASIKEWAERQPAVLTAQGPEPSNRPKTKLNGGSRKRRANKNSKTRRH